jgi:hypothetical protein
MHRRPTAASRMSTARAAALALAATLGAACSPALDWRELRPDGSGAVVLLPCKPASHARRVPLAGGVVEWTLYACSAGGVTWALGFAELEDPARVGPALAELEAAALANIGAAAPEARQALRVDGATPHPASALLAARGRLADGTEVQERVALFSKGTRVYQATAVGAALPPEALESFLDGLRTP